MISTGSLGDVEWQLPIEHLDIQDCTDSGKELTQLLSHLPKLAKLRIRHCEKITRMGVEVEQQQRTGPVSWPSSSAVKMEDPQATDQQQQIAEGVEEEEQDEEDGLLLFPAHNSLRDLYIDSDCRKPPLILVASPPLLPNGHKAGGIDGVGGLQALRSLQELSIWNCRKLLSAYSSSSCCPFPSTLQYLELGGVTMETLEPLSNLTSLTRLRMQGCGEDLRGEGLWHLLTRGQLSELIVHGSPKFFAFQTIGDQEQQPPKLSKLTTDDIAGVLAAPICRLLSSSLTDLNFKQLGSELHKEVERFTKEQEEAFHLLTSLQELSFHCCVKLQSLPAGLHRLTSLKILRIVCCRAIRSLPKDDFDFLRSLRLFDNHSGSEELTRQCRKLTGTTPIIRA